MDEMITVYLYGKKYPVISWFVAAAAVTVSVVLVLLFTVLRVRQLFMAAWHVPQRLRTTCV